MADQNWLQMLRGGTEREGEGEGEREREGGGRKERERDATPSMCRHSHTTCAAHE